MSFFARPNSSNQQYTDNRNVPHYRPTQNHTRGGYNSNQNYRGRGGGGGGYQNDSYRGNQYHEDSYNQQNHYRGGRGNAEGTGRGQYRGNNQGHRGQIHNHSNHHNQNAGRQGPVPIKKTEDPFEALKDGDSEQVAALERTFGSELPMYHFSSFGFEKLPCLFHQDISQEELRWRFMQDKAPGFEDDLRMRTESQIKLILQNPREVLKAPQNYALEHQRASSEMELDVMSRRQSQHIPQAPKIILPAKSPPPKADDSIWLQPSFEFGLIPEDEPPMHVR